VTLKRKPLNRRSFLRGAGGALVALPPLAAMLRPGQSVAQASEIPTRAVFFFSPNGTILPRWRPTGTERDFTLSEILQPLAAHQSQLNILDGVAMMTAIENSGGQNGHDIGTGHCLTARKLIAGPTGFGEFGHLFDGTAGGDSIDQAIARRLPQTTPFDSLQFGVEAKRLKMPLPSRMTWKQNGDVVEAVEPMQDPAAAYDRLFGNVQGDPAELERLKIKRKLVVDAVLDDYKATRALLGAEDQTKLDAHLSALADLERRLGQLGAATGCQPPTRTEAGNFSETGTAMLDLISAALGCNLTRVATLQWETGQGSNRFSSLGTERAHHDLSHDGNSETATQDILTNINKFYAEQFAALLTRMSAVVELDGKSLLDHSAVLWVHEVDTGNDHTYDNMPYVMAGSAGGAFETGRYLKFDKKPHGELFLSIMNSMGLAETSFGDPEFCSGPLVGL
jgi:hypothetical protein